MKDLKELLKEFFYYLDNEENITVNSTIEKFKQLFDNKYFEDYYSINEAYYNFQETKYYLKESNGIKFSIIGGDWDIFGNQHSHNGLDLVISSELSENKEIRKGIVIFSENEFVNETYSNKLDDFFNVDLSYESIIQSRDNNIYNTLSEDIKNSTEIVENRYHQLKQQAELQNKDEIDYELISPYGGLDVTVHAVPELLYDSITKFKNDNYFYNNAMKLFNKEYESYLKNEINECEYALFIIEHQDEYESIFWNEYEIILTNSGPGIDIENVLEGKGKIEKELEKLRKEYDELNRKKYNLFDIIKGSKKIDKNRLQELYSSENNNGLINYYEKELANYQSKEKEYNSKIEHCKECEDKIQKMRKKLERPYKNFTLNPDLHDLVENGKYFYLESLYKLIEKKDFYKDKLKEYEDVLNIAQETNEIVEETQFEEEDELEM